MAPTPPPPRPPPRGGESQNFTTLLLIHSPNHQRCSDGGRGEFRCTSDERTKVVDHHRTVPDTKERTLLCSRGGTSPVCRLSSIGALLFALEALEKMGL